MASSTWGAVVQEQEEQVFWAVLKRGAVTEKVGVSPDRSRAMATIKPMSPFIHLPDLIIQQILF